MKRIILTIFIILIFSQTVFGEETDKKITLHSSPGLIVANILHLNFHDDFLFDALFFDFEFQFKFCNLLNLALPLSFLYFSENDYRGERDFMMHLSPALIFRPFRTGLSGFHISLYPIIGLVTINEKKWDGSGNRYWEKHYFAEFGGGIDIGYKWIFKNGFSLQLGTGINYRDHYPVSHYYQIWHFTNSDGSSPLAYYCFAIKPLDLKIGYSW